MIVIVQIIVYKQHKNSEGYFYGQGIQHYRSKNFDEAMICYNNAIKVNPTHADSYYKKSCL